MPITLGDPLTSSSPNWNKYILVSLWIVQLLLAISLGFWAAIAWVLSAGSGIIFLILVANSLAILATIYEIYHFYNATLTVRDYYRFELVKAGYCVGLLYIGLLYWVWVSVGYVVPFWFSFWYAVRVRKDEEGVFWRDVKELW